jgi:2-keto-4-pentenoate hydratase/2-oxohepta-3-ene-1,7-dioic acid hydratase in catechol pathway
MRIANAGGRLVLVAGAAGGEVAVDVEQASGGRFAADPQDVWADWAGFRAWGASVDVGATGRPLGELGDLGPPVPRPRQVFGVALNYSDHAAESRLEAPASALVFTKFPSAVTGPYAELPLPSDSVDWEVELVVVVADAARHVPAEQAWSVVGGVTVGQDFSEREVQLRGTPPQFSLGKSYPAFAPIGPVLVTPDELATRDALAMRCWVNDELVQDGSTANLIHPVSRLIAQLSAVVNLLPGDLIFTGTPGGVGMARTPPRYLAPGDVVTSWIDGIGELRNSCVAERAARL